MKKQWKRQSLLLWLVESALMLAAAIVLSEVLKFSLPFGGSVTVFGQVPILLIAYRHGFRRGLVTALVFGAVEMPFGLGNFAYVKTLPTILAVALLDYLLAFGALSLGALLRGRVHAKAEQRSFFRRIFHNTQVLELAGGALIAGLVRYICHVLSGILVWNEYATADFFTGIPFLYHFSSGLSVNMLVIFYSFCYNAAYMLPEICMSVFAMFVLGNVMDLRKAQIRFGAVK